MPKNNSPADVADALNQLGPQESPSTTWIVMVVGPGPRPHVTCSTDLALAYTGFLQNLRMVVGLAPDGEFKIAADDYDGMLMGLSVYLNDYLVLTIQPAGQIVSHPAFPAGVQAAPESFETVGPWLLAALAKRAGLDPADAERFRYSMVARACTTDVDAAIMEDALSEADVAGKFDDSQLDRMWKSLEDARTMLTMSAVVKG